VNHSQFLGKTTAAEWAAYRAGQARADRMAWMRDAEKYKDSGSTAAMRSAVKAARQCNHDYLKAREEFRLAKTRPSYEDWERRQRAEQGYRMRTVYREPLDEGAV
jgi:hypothetical protein